jgi:hypothetical protein
LLLAGTDWKALAEIRLAEAAVAVNASHMDDGEAKAIPGAGEVELSG